MRNNRIKLSSIVCGLLIVAAGVLLFAFNAGILEPEYKRIVFSWQMLLIALGFVFLFSRHKWTAGIVLILVGGFFMQRLNIENINFFIQNGWAIGLIVAGILIICKTIWGKHFFVLNFESSGTEKRRHHHRHKHSHDWTNHDTVSGRIDYNSVFSGRQVKCDNKIFRGGEINSVFGGIELDLSDAQLAEGTNYLELNSVFGGIVLYVPVEWKIELRQTQVFGSFVDNRPKPGFDVDENRILIIEANSVFGGGEIKCK